MPGRLLLPTVIPLGGVVMGRGIFAGFVAGLAAASACGAAPQSYVPLDPSSALPSTDEAQLRHFATASPAAENPIEIHVSEDDSGRRIELTLGQVLIISLPSNPSTGFTWEVQQVDAGTLHQQGDSLFKPRSSLTGAPAIQTMRFEVIGRGQSVLDLAYRRPWEKDVPPARTFTLTLIVP